MNQAVDNLNRIDGRIAVVGSMNADLTVRTHAIPHPGETVPGQPLQILPGGKSANQAVCAAKLGANVTMIGAVGNDSNRLVLEESFRNAGVDTQHVTTMDCATGTAVITVDDSGENTIVVSPGANGLVTPELIDRCAQAITEADVVGLCLEVPFETVRHTAELAKKAGTKVVFNLSPIISIDTDFLSLLDIIIVNEHELSHVLGDHGGRDAAEVAKLVEHADASLGDDIWLHVKDILLGLGIGAAIITLGGDGSVVLHKDGIERIQPRRIDAVDTTGCGDSYMATILCSVASGMSLVEGADMATLVSAYAAGGQGAQNSYGTVDEITQRFA